MTAEIRKIMPDLPIVALTADVTKDMMDQIKDSHMKTYLNKPVKIEGLREVLEKYGGLKPEGADED